MTVELEDRPETLGVPRALVDALVRHYRPREIILFGSRARGEAGPESDIDLFVIVDDDAQPTRGPGRTGVDLFVRTASAFERERRLVGTLANAAGEDGITLWRRPGLRAEPRRIEMASEEEQRAAALDWLARAERDLRVAELALAADPDLVENVAFHLQQVAEKVLEGLLAARRERFRKIHRLGELAERVARLYPDLAPHLGGLDPYTVWVIAGRYGGPPEDGAPIDRPTVEAFLGRCRTLLAAARTALGTSRPTS